MDKLHLYRCLFLFPVLALALPQATPTSAAFPTMSAQDGMGVSEGGVGSTVNAGAAAGADGADKGAFSLSTGAIIGIAVGIALVVIGIGAMWALWYLAKKRQWDVRQSIRRASRRLTGRKVEPKTPRKNNRGGTVYIKSPPPGKRNRDRDVENGTASQTMPTKGWLADEKERSRSRSRSRGNEERGQNKQEEQPAPTGWKAKLPFGKR